MALLLLACNKDEETVYATRFHGYGWEVDTVPLTVPSAPYDQAIQLKDLEGNTGGIDGVTDVYAVDGQDTTIFRNTALRNNRMAIITDTIEGKWFTIINIDKKQLRIILNENAGTEKRTLYMAFWSYHLDKRLYDDGHPTCDPLTIYQLPAGQ